MAGWRRYERVIVLLAALLGVAVTARLGWWQLDRASQKNDLQQQIDTRRAMPPLTERDLTGATAEGLHQRRAQFRGRWAGEAPAVFLDNRQMNGRPGFYVLSPFVLPDGTAVVVQRGWLPRDVRDRTRVQAPALPADEQLLVGRLAPPPARLLEFQGGDTGPIRQNVDIAQLAALWPVPLRPFTVLQLEATGPDDGLQRQWPEPGSGVHKHYGYAFQWFALAALIVALYVWFQIIRRPRQR